MYTLIIIVIGVSGKAITTVPHLNFETCNKAMIALNAKSDNFTTIATYCVLNG